eukprot:3145279-Pleurochrysis_carterae.AAC.2
MAARLLAMHAALCISPPGTAADGHQSQQGASLRCMRRLFTHIVPQQSHRRLIVRVLTVARRWRAKSPYHSQHLHISYSVSSVHSWRSALFYRAVAKLVGRSWYFLLASSGRGTSSALGSDALYYEHKLTRTTAKARPMDTQRCTGKKGTPDQEPAHANKEKRQRRNCSTRVRGEEVDARIYGAVSEKMPGNETKKYTATDQNTVTEGILTASAATRQQL